MNRSKGLLLIIILLLLSNVVAWYLVFSGNRSGHNDHQAAFRSFLQKDVKFSTDQLKSFDRLVEGRDETMLEVRRKFREARRKQSRLLLTDNFSDSVIRSQAHNNAEVQQQMEINYWNYFKSVRALCTPEQLAVFDSGWINMMSAKRKKK